jgi:hypothetical protein
MDAPISGPSLLISVNSLVSGKQFASIRPPILPDCC